MEYYCKNCSKLLIKMYVDENGYNTIYAVNTISLEDNCYMDGMSIGRILRGNFNIDCPNCDINNKFTDKIINEEVK